MTSTPDLRLVLDALTIAADHLMQYQRYAEEMRDIGRGLVPSSPYSPESTNAIVLAALDTLRNITPSGNGAALTSDRDQARLRILKAIATRQQAQREAREAAEAAQG